MRFFTDILKVVLKHLALATIWKFQPVVVGITGSVGKTSTKHAIAAVLSRDRTIRMSHANLNNELGFPLTILGEWDREELTLISRDYPAGRGREKKLFFWGKVITLSLWNIIVAKRSSYPEFLVLEYGADKPGDIKYLLSIAKPSVAIITAVGDVPVHVEFYFGPEDVAREKVRLIEALSSAGYAILNFDDATVMKLKDRTRGHVMTFGFEKGATVQCSSFETREVDGRPEGVSFKIEYAGSFVPVKIDEIFGRVQGYASAAAAATGLIFGMNLVKISESLRSYRPPSGRMNLREGMRGSWIIDDSYNASPLSVQAAIETLKTLPAKRRVAILGDMLELGKYSMDAHEKIGKSVAKAADVLITVGARGKLIANGAQSAGLAAKNIHVFDTTEDALDKIADIIKSGDVVLVKASHAMGFEEIVKTLSAPPAEQPLS